MPLSAAAISELSDLLSLNISDLCRPLSPYETYEWAYYRVSHAYRDTVWQNAQDAWRAAGLSTKDAADAMGFPRPLVQRQIQSDLTANTTLSWPPAQRLAATLSYTDDTHPFLPAHFQGRDLP